MDAVIGEAESAVEGETADIVGAYGRADRRQPLSPRLGLRRGEELRANPFLRLANSAEGGDVADVVR